MVRVTLRLRVKSGREGEFEEAWRGVARFVEATDGSLGQALLRDRDDPQTYVITSDWSSEATFREFERSEVQDVATAPLRELRLSSRMSVEDLVARVGRDQSQGVPA